MASFGAYPWYANQAAVGLHVVNMPAIFTGYVQKQGGVRSWQPNIVAPGTVASAGTVFNSTGLDCVVYVQALAGGSITAVKVLSSQFSTATAYTLPSGTVAYPNIISVVVPGPGGIAVSYNATMNWVWQPL